MAQEIAQEASEGTLSSDEILLQIADDVDDKTNVKLLKEYMMLNFLKQAEQFNECLSLTDVRRR